MNVGCCTIRVIKQQLWIKTKKKQRMNEWMTLYYNGSNKHKSL